eukprot:m.116092 g.116092  ORF g.116092 m.116092 type:complete len:286 (+) comp13590_c0_seq1:214-1071(+)
MAAVLQMVEEWLTGSPVLPGFKEPIQGEPCDGAACYSLSRVYVASFLLHWGLFVLSLVLSPLLSKSYRALDFANKMYWHSCMVATFHATVSAYGAIYGLYFGPEFLEEGHTVGSSPIIDVTSIFSSGYFLYDLILLAVMAAQGHAIFQSTAMFLHHSIGSSIFLVSTHYKLSWCTGTFLATEITNPFTNLRFLFVYMNMRKSYLYVVNGVLLTIFYTIFRIIAIAYFWPVWLSDMPYVLSVNGWPMVSLAAFGTATGTFLNVMWFKKVMRGCLKVLSEGMGAKDD